MEWINPGVVALIGLTGGFCGILFGFAVGIGPILGMVLGVFVPQAVYIAVKRASQGGGK